MFYFNRFEIVFIVLDFVRRLNADDGCSDPGVPVSGQLENSLHNYSHTYTVEYSCPVSHQLFGDKYRRCLNGVWTGNVPICGTRMLVENVTQSSDYMLNVASRAIDSNYTTCAITYTDHVIWLGEIHHDTAVSGVRVTTPRKKSAANNQKLSVTIATRYKFNDNGINPIECLETVGYDDGKSKEVERLFLCPQKTKGNVIYVKPKDPSSNNPYRFMELCEVELFTTENLWCRVPDNLKNGHRRSMLNASSHYYIFTCNAGYQIYGSDKIYCTPNGTWNPRIPFCVAINCTKPPPISNGYYRESIKSAATYFAFNDSVEYFCDPNYELIGEINERLKRCVGVDQWSGDPLFCQPSNRSKTPFGSTRVYNRGAKFSQGQGQEFPTTTTKSSSLTTRCRNKSRKVNNGRLIFGNFSISLECDLGFESVGTRTSTCQPSKEIQGQYQWQPPLNFECKTKATTSPLEGVVDTDGKERLFCPPPSIDNGFRILEIANEGNFGGKTTRGEEGEFGGKITRGDAREFGGKTTREEEGDFGGKTFSEGTKIHVQCGDKIPPVAGFMVCTGGIWTKVHCVEIDVISGKVETRSSSDNNNELIVPIVAFLIGVGTTVLMVGLGACVFVYRKSRLRGSHQSQSLFHINLTSGNVNRNNNNSNRINTNQDDEHIYQIPAYEDLLTSESLRESEEPETPKRREPSSGLPLLPIYSQPFENDNYRVTGVHSNVHIYAEPLRETVATKSITCTSTDSRSTESLNYLYSESRHNSIRTFTSDSVFIENEDENENLNNHDLNMVDNDLYVSEDDSFQEI